MLSEERVRVDRETEAILFFYCHCLLQMSSSHHRTCPIAPDGQMILLFSASWTLDSDLTSRFLSINDNGVDGRGVRTI